MTFSRKEIVTDIKGTEKAPHSNNTSTLVNNVIFINYFSLLIIQSDDTE